jgi:plastocyanin
MIPTGRSATVAITVNGGRIRVDPDTVDVVRGDTVVWE